MPLFRACLALSLTSAFAGAAEWQLRNLKEEVIKGELVGIEGKAVVLKTEKGVVSVPMPEVLQLEIQPAKSSGSHSLVELTDGTILRVKPETGFTVENKQVELTLLSDRKLKVPLTSLSYIFKDGHDAKTRAHADWKAVLKSRKNRDIFVRWYEGRMNGIPGTFGEGKGTLLDFQTDSGLQVQVDLNHKAVQAWVFVNKPDANLPAPVCQVIDSEDNLILAKQVTTAENGDVLVTTIHGSQLRYPPKELARLDFSGGKRVYLSELEPRVLEERTEDKEPLRRDKNPNDGPLQLAGQKYPRGVSLFAPMVLAYPLGGEYKEFIATLGVDDNVDGNTHVKVLIEGDGRELYAQEIKKSDKPRGVRLNVKDVQELRIKVHPVGILPFGHHVNIADAKVTK